MRSCYQLRNRVVDIAGAVLRQFRQHSFVGQGKLSSRAFTTADMEIGSAVNYQEIERNLQTVRERLKNAYDSASIDVRSPTFPRLVAVSKTKPAEAVIAAYEAGQRDFGENYVDKLIERADDEKLTEFCPEIRWRFIGTLQSQNINKLLKKCPRLCCVETVSSRKYAEQLNRTWSQLSKPTPLPILIQVNTSGEYQKGGLAPDGAIQLAKEVLGELPSLKFEGFMTIGSFAQSVANSDQNPDFQALIETKRQFCLDMNYSLEQQHGVELSMGMSADFELAVRMGSTNVRVGTTIFGSR